MTVAADPFSLLGDVELERMTKAAWYRAARAHAEVREHCAQHGSGGHTEACLILANSAGSDDRYWHRLMDEKARRRFIQS